MTIGKKLRVLLAIRTLSGGGAELVVETLALRLDPTRFDVVVCELLSTGEKAEGLRARGFEVISLVPSGNVRSTYLNFMRLRRLEAARGFDVIHSHSPATLADAGLCRLLRSRLKIIHTFHFGNYPHVDPSIARLERMFHRSADALVTVGHGQAEAICATYGIPVSRLRTIWNGVTLRPPRLDRERMAPYLDSGRVLIGTIGTLFEQKGHTDLLEVALRLKQREIPATFLIVGGGPLRQALEKRCHQLGLMGYVEFLGWVKDAADTILPALDIFFQPSRWEAMSMVLLEAAAAGKAIVCTDVGEAPRILVEGVSGFMTKPADLLSMADRLERLVADEALRRRMGAAARVVVERDCSAAAMVRRYEDLYAEVTNHHGARESAA